MSRDASKCPKCYWSHLETWADPDDCDEHPCSKGMPQTRYGYEYKHGLCPIFESGKNPQIIEVEERHRRNGYIALCVVSSIVTAPILSRLLGLVSWSWESCFAPLIGVSCIVLFMGSIALACGYFNPTTAEDDA